VRASEREVTKVNLNDVVPGRSISSHIGSASTRYGGRSLDASLPPVLATAIKLEQVAVNLLSKRDRRAARVTPPRQLTLDTWVQDGNVSVAVGDNGKGVAP